VSNVPVVKLKSVYAVAVVNNLLLLLLLSAADVNECRMYPDYCAPEAICVNTVGSYYCQCGVGYVGDGERCTGIAYTVIISIALYQRYNVM